MIRDEMNHNYIIGSSTSNSQVSYLLILYVIKDLAPYKLSLWHVACWHQLITPTNIDLSSVKFHAFSWQMLFTLIITMYLEVVL